MTKPDDSDSPETIDSIGNSLILYNDPVNSFPHVIAALVQVLGWTEQQSEQAAFIAHTKGKYRLKTGSYIELVTDKYELEACNLTVELQ